MSGGSIIVGSGHALQFNNIAAIINSLLCLNLSLENITIIKEYYNYFYHA